MVITRMALHHHHHTHVHDHASHSHAPDHFGAAFAAGALLNAAFVVAELGFGYAANSLALISDAVHNLSDVIALLLAWGGMWLAGKRPTETHTYGYRRASIQRSGCASPPSCSRADGGWRATASISHWTPSRGASSLRR